jgi:hypothetical protein
MSPLSQVTNNLEAISPSRGDRVGVFGQTGTGKTTLVQALLQKRDFVVVCDPKRKIEWPGYVVLDFNQLLKIDPAKVRKIIYKPTFADITEKKGAIIDSFFRWVFERENTTLYVDELSMIASGDDYPFHYGACLTQGRELGIEVISGTQRPTWIPQIAMSEAEHVYCFKLKLFADRQRIERLTSIPEEKISQLQKRDFLYAPQDGDIVGPLRLQIGNQMAA